MLAQLALMMQRRRATAGPGAAGADDGEGGVEVDEDGVRVVLDDRCSVSPHQRNQGGLSNY